MVGFKNLRLKLSRYFFVVQSTKTTIREKVRDTYLDVEEFLGEHWGPVVNWVTRSIECSTKHFNAHWHSKYITGELASGRNVIDT